MRRGFAPAKVNLWLHIGPPRRDGYHPINSLIVFALDVGDELRADTEAGDDALTLEISGEWSGGLDNEDNLVLSAARALAKAAHKRHHGAHFHLEKSIPLAAGLGGGSADAAACLRLLNTQWELDWRMSRLNKIAAKVGADVPVCLWSRPAVVEGKGERVEPLSAWPELFAVLVNPRVELPTGPVFQRYDQHADGKLRRIPAPLGIAHREEAMALVRDGRNDLQDAGIELVPEIGDVIDALENSEKCSLARMTGSGATCFGLYDSHESAARASAAISSAHPDWWTAATRLGGWEEEV